MDLILLLLIDHKENRRLLAEWLGQRYQIQLPNETVAGFSQPYDLAIVDGVALDRHWQDLQARKEAEAPLFLPLLLVTSRQDVSLVTRQLWQSIDEFITSPIEKIELVARVEVLLRARHQSVQLAQANRQLQREEETQRFIVAVSTLLASSLDYKEPLQKVARLSLSFLGDYCEFNLLTEGGETFERVALAHRDPTKEALAREEDNRYRLDQNAPPLLTYVPPSNQPVLISEITAETLKAMAPDAEYLAHLLPFNPRAVIQVPLTARDRMLGILSFVSAESGQPYGPEELRLAEEVARRASVAIDNGQLYQKLQQDILERQRVEEALRRNEELYRTLVRNLPDSSVLLFDRELRFMLAEGEALNRNDFLPGQVEGKTLWEVMSPPNAAEMEPYYRAALAGLRNSFETSYDGRSFLVQAVPVKDENGRIFAGMLLNTEITALKEAERLLAAEKEHLAVTLRSIGDGVITTDLEGRVTMLNRVAEKLTGWKQEAASGQPLSTILQFIDEESRQPLPLPVDVALKRGEVVEMPNHAILIARDGTERNIGDSAAPIRDRDSQVLGAVLVFRDVTEQHRRDAEMVKTSKLEALGVLAGGIAHDFNNLLTGLMGNVSLARYLAAAKSPLDEIDSCLEEAEKAARRSKKLAQQLLTFARGGEPVKQVLQLGPVIQEAAELVLRGSSVEGGFQLSEKLWLVEADAGQIGQVIQNLVLNAVQAMPQGGRVTIKAENLRVSQGLLVGLNAGNYLKVTVQDTGAGVTPEVLLKIFDPYFTTKPDGNGLGLAVCYSIVKKHDGHLTVASVVGEGTTFELYLPAMVDRAKYGTEPIVAGPVRVESLKRGQGRVLVMDDDAVIRSVVVRQLKHLGYEAEAVGDGQAAIVRYQEKRNAGQPFDLVILDLTVPGGMGGMDTLTALRELDPGVKVIVSSGYATDPIMAEYVQYGFVAVLVKPYRLEEMSETLAHLLSEV